MKKGLKAGIAAESPDQKVFQDERERFFSSGPCLLDFEAEIGRQSGEGAAAN
jgi:hypothetical protein